MKLDSKLLKDEYKDKIIVSDSVLSGGNLRVEAPVKLTQANIKTNKLGTEIGAFSVIWHNAKLRNVEKIGRCVSIAQDSFLWGSNHAIMGVSSHSLFEGCDINWMKPYAPSLADEEWLRMNRENMNKYEPDKGGIIIGNDVWIGGGATLLAGVEVADGTIIGAKSVVTKSTRPYSIVVGNPAREVKLRFDEKIIERLLEIKWWEYGPDILQGLNIFDMEETLNQVEKRIAGGFVKYNAEMLTINCM